MTRDEQIEAIQDAAFEMGQAASAPVFREIAVLLIRVATESQHDTHFSDIVLGAAYEVAVDWNIAVAEDNKPEDKK